VIATPDHTHAIATLAALETGRHVYCEKPLTHTVAEARKVTDAARKHRRVTQMGTQIHASGNYRRVVEIIQSGAIGEVGEVHCWADRVWSGSGERPTETPPVPAHLHWDLWLGRAPVRPYHPAYVPINWRGWWAFGGGTLGDMGCHHMDLPYWALDLRHPETIEAEGPPTNTETTPAWLIVRYTYPSRDKKPPVHLTWYNGGKRPPHFAEKTVPEWGDGTLFVGKKGMLLANYDRYVLLPEKDFAGFEPPKPFIPDSIGHHAEWILACKTGGKTTCNFDYSGVLTEAVLLGNVAYRTGTRLEWDARKLKAKNCPEAELYLKPEYEQDTSARRKR
jgi:predicted dehydrogenase